MLQRPKFYMVQPVSTASSATTACTIDRLGFDYVDIAVMAGTGADTNPMTTVKIGQGDTTTAYTDIEALTGGTSVVAGSTGFVIPDHNATTAVTTPQIVFGVDCRNLKRYLKVSVTPSTTNVLGVVAVLRRAKEMPVGTTAQNAKCVVYA